MIVLLTIRSLKGLGFSHSTPECRSDIPGFLPWVPSMRFNLSLLVQILQDAVVHNNAALVVVQYKRTETLIAQVEQLTTEKVFLHDVKLPSKLSPTAFGHHREQGAE